MILIKILNNINNKDSLNKSLKSFNLIKKEGKLKYIHKIKNLVYLKNLKQKPVNYILTLTVSLTNTLINLSDAEGKLIISLSSGSINLKKKQKTLQPLAMINLLKSLILLTNFKNNESLTIHFKNIKSYYESIIINLLKNIIFIKIQKHL